LQAASEESVAALTGELDAVIAPYRRRVLRAVALSSVVVDLDLTGLVVSDQATTYEGADFGYMGELGKAGKGYQFARAQLLGATDTLVLGGFLHSGRTVALHCVAELVGLVEATLGRPRRRVELVAQRLVAAREQLATVEAELATPSRWPRQQQRRETRRARLQAAVTELEARLEQMAADNESNRTPRRIILRLDGGFGDAPHLAWLYEQGYSFVARGHDRFLTARLRKEPHGAWEHISKNGFIAESAGTDLRHCPYPVRLFLCRQWWGQERPEHWSSLVVSADLDHQDWPSRRAGVFYNQRQWMEAGIKESKGVFASRHFPTRHREGIALYQELVLLAQNLLRWFRRQVLRRTPLATLGIKDLVHGAARCRAVVLTARRLVVLQFAHSGRWGGLVVRLALDQPYQLWFPFLESGP
jgi:hypothetical protein